MRVGKIFDGDALERRRRAKDVVAIRAAPNLDELWPPFFVEGPAQIRMEHVVVDRAGPDDRDLDHQVVDGARFDGRRHRHLGPTLDLKRAERVGFGSWHRCAGPRQDRRAVDLDALLLS